MTKIKDIHKKYNLSAIVPFYNEEKFLEASVLRLLETNIFEKIILVNDNSTLIDEYGSIDFLDTVRSIVVKAVLR